MFTNPNLLNTCGSSTFGAITDHYAMDTPLAPSDDPSRFAIDHCSDAAFWMEPNGHIIYVNNEACRILGYERQELLRMSIQDVDPHFQADAWAEHWQLIKQNRRLCLESLHLTKSGQRIPVDIRANYVHLGNKEFNCIFARDLTADKRTECKIKEYEARLNMSQRMEALGTLSGGIAHDFNNILSAILGYADICLGSLPKEAPQQNYLREIIAAGMRARELVHQILTFGRQASQSLHPLQFKTIAKEALKLLRASIPSTIDIRANMVSDGLVKADAVQLHQIVMNLCIHAAQSMLPDGGTMHVSLENVTLGADDGTRPPGIEPGRYLRWMVSDTGKGVETPGQEAASGLPAVRDIVGAIGGHMHVERQADQGTVASILLPLLERDKRPVAEPVESLPVGTGKEHILVVDDEAPVVKMFTMMLERMRYRVTSRTSSIEALALFKEQGAQFDMVITDLTMPYLPGPKLAAELIKIRPGIPIILCTGYNNEMPAEKMAKTGIQATIMKPIARAALATTVRDLLDRFQAAA